MRHLACVIYPAVQAIAQGLTVLRNSATICLLSTYRASPNGRGEFPFKHAGSSGFDGSISNRYQSFFRAK
jgi:hypothetical protein